MSCGHLDADQTQRLIEQASSMGIKRILAAREHFAAYQAAA